MAEALPRPPAADVPEVTGAAVTEARRDPGAFDVSILVPAKDEVGSLPQLAAEVAAAMDGAPGRPHGWRWELVIVDDGSSDGSWETVERLSAGDARVRGLRMRRNFGKSAALAAAVQASHGEYVVTMDADLQDDPAELPEMLAKLDGGADLVAGHKLERRDPLGKRLPSKLFNSVTSLVTGLRLHDHNCGLKAGRREVFTSTPLYGEMHRYLAAISHAQGFRVVEQPVNHRPRQHGRSKFGLERYARGGLDLLTVVTLTRYRRRPAHLFGGLGLVLGLSGMAILLYLTGVWFLTDQPIGGRPLLLLGALLLVVAVQLASVGLLAELLVHRQAAEEDPLRHVVAVVGVPGGAGP
ncbi:MAG: glycosyltransferase family 2 protein [Nitriliruptor sp.]